MDITVRKSEDNIWGFVETFTTYQTIEEGNIKCTLSITPEGKFSTPYVLRDGVFIPLKQIEEEMGIDKYIKAKKPFYSLLNDGFIVFMKCGLNYVSHTYIPEKSAFTVYKVGSKSVESPSKGTLHLVSLLEVPDNVTELLHHLASELIKCNGDREKFLRSRI